MHKAVIQFHKKMNSLDRQLYDKLNKFVRKLEVAAEGILGIRNKVSSLIDTASQTVDVKKMLQNTYLKLVNVLERKEVPSLSDIQEKAEDYIKALEEFPRPLL